MRPYNRYSSKPLLVKIVTRIALTQRTHDRASLQPLLVGASLHDRRHDGAFIGMRRPPLEDVETFADHSVTLRATELRLDELSYYLCTVYLCREALTNIPHPSHSYGYDTAIGVALTRRTTPITLLFICDERVLSAEAS